MLMCNSDVKLKERDKQLLTKLHTMVESEYNNETLNLEYLSSKLYLSPRALQRKVKNLTSCTPMEYVRGVRIAKAANLLDSTNSSISQIALDTGFNSLNYFSRTFKEVVSVSPRQYREKALATLLEGQVRQIEPKSDGEKRTRKPLETIQ